MGDVHPIDSYFNKVVSNINFIDGLSIFKNNSDESVWYNESGWVFYLNDFRFIANNERFWNGLKDVFIFDSDESLFILKFLMEDWLSRDLDVDFELPVFWNSKVEEILKDGGISSEWKIQDVLLKKGLIS